MFEEAVRYAPDSAGIWNNYSVAMSRLGKIPKSTGAARVSVAAGERTVGPTPGDLLRLNVSRFTLAQGLLNSRDEEEKDEGKMLGIPRAPAPATRDSAARSAPAPRPAPAPEYVLSGMVRNPDVISGQGAIFDVPLGKGHLIAFTFNPLHRWLNHHEFPLVWNTLMHWNHLPAPAAR
jgi:hypothetical protein